MNDAEMGPSARCQDRLESISQAPKTSIADAGCRRVSDHHRSLGRYLRISMG
jgi:hypothetical protein